MHAAKLGLTEREVLTNVITSLTSNQMIAPNLWIDPRNGNNYFLTVQYPEEQIRSIQDLRAIPLHADGVAEADAAGHDREYRTHQSADRSGSLPDPPQARYLCSGRPARTWAPLRTAVATVIAQETFRSNVTVAVRGSVEAMNASFKSFAIGLTLSVVLLYLILVAQFRSFIDPSIILLALPPGISGVLITLVLTGTTLNVMSLMGVVMLAGIAMSNSILIVEFAHHLLDRGSSTCGGDCRILPRAPAADSDDLARDDHRAAADGDETRRRQRVICAVSAGADRGPLSFRDAHSVPGSGRFYPDLSEQELRPDYAVTGT